MAIQNDETLVTKGNLKELYQDKILPYLGGNFALSTNVSDYYSTDEKIIGVWVDGKPIYQLVIFATGSYTLTNAWTGFDAPLTPIDTLITGKCLRANNQEDTGCYVSYNSTETKVWVRSPIENINFVNPIIIVQYTKTTDATNSAAATPGCYDINFPNTWPENTEIYFGNGVYGYRTTGSMNMTKQTHNNVSCNVTAAKFINQGGNWGANNNYEYPFGSTWNGNGSSSIAWINHSNSNQINLAFWPDNNLTNSAYDVWVTYTK